MSVLKKIGNFLRGTSADITAFLGFPFLSSVLSMIPGKAGQVAAVVTSDLNAIAGIIATSEGMFPSDGTGSQKLAAAAPFVQKQILIWAQSALPGHNKVKDPAKLALDCKALTSAFADIFNDFGE